MDKTTIIKTLRDMAKHPTVTLPRDTDALRAAADLLEQAERNQFNPDWDAMAVMVEEQQRMAKRIEELEQAEKQEPVAYVTDNYSRDGVNDEISVFLPVGTTIYTAPPPRQPLTDEEERKVARLFSNRVAEMCNVDADDHWKYHFDDVLSDVQFVLKAAHGIKGNT